MRKYEAVFILRPDLNESERNSMFDKIKETLEKFDSKITNARIWFEKQRLRYELVLKGKSTRLRDALFYLVDFEATPTHIEKVNAAYRLNDEIIRFLVIAKEQ